jgi:hypothetical protein
VTADLLTAAAEHGPGMHGGVVGTIVIAVVAVGGLIYLVRRRGRGPEA